MPGADGQADPDPDPPCLFQSLLGESALRVTPKYPTLLGAGREVQQQGTRPRPPSPRLQASQAPGARTHSLAGWGRANWGL